jgi:hypothetical protein
MRQDAIARPDESVGTINLAGGYACALYIDLKTNGQAITFSNETLAKCGGIPSDPQFFRHFDALDELLSQVGHLLSDS